MSYPWDYGWVNIHAREMHQLYILYVHNTYILTKKGTGRIDFELFFRLWMKMNTHEREMHQWYITDRRRHAHAHVYRITFIPYRLNINRARLAIWTRIFLELWWESRTSAYTCSMYIIVHHPISNRFLLLIVARFVRKWQQYRMLAHKQLNYSLVWISCL